MYVYTYIYIYMYIYIYIYIHICSEVARDCQVPWRRWKYVVLGKTRKFDGTLSLVPPTASFQKRDTEKWARSLGGLDFQRVL